MTVQPIDLPQPSEEALDSSRKLVERIREEIHVRGGKISFADYMDLALYTPGLGYYSGGSRKIGAVGDFVTAPEISSVFSECLTNQIQQILVGLAGSNDVSVLEVGAGSGRMAADILSYLENSKILPAQYMILELSAELKHRQYETLKKMVPHLLSKVVWIDRLPQQNFYGVVVANELLDAMPVHKFVFEANTLRECFVTWKDEHLHWGVSDLTSTAIETRVNSFIQGFTTGYTSEVNLAASAWIKTIGQFLTRGVILIIDYGYPRHEYYHPQRNTGTLMCHYQHRAHQDPLFYPGLQDITAHVDFTSLAESAIEVELSVAGYTTQTHFLIDCGLGKIAERRFNHDLKQQMAVSQQIKKLTLPSEMGELVKVMGLTRDFLEPLLGFSSLDLRQKL